MRLLSDKRIVLVATFGAVVLSGLAQLLPGDGPFYGALALFIAYSAIMFGHFMALSKEDAR